MVCSASSSSVSPSSDGQMERPQFVQEPLESIRRSLCCGRHALKISIQVWKDPCPEKKRIGNIVSFVNFSHTNEPIVWTWVVSFH